MLGAAKAGGVGRATGNGKGSPGRILRQAEKGGDVIDDDDACATAGTGATGFSVVTVAVALLGKGD